MKLYLKNNVPIARSYAVKDGYIFEEGIGNKDVAPCVMSSFFASSSTRLYSKNQLDRYEKALFRKHRLSLTVTDEDHNYDITL